MGASSVSLNVVAGTTYRIAVDGNGGTTGTFRLEWLLARCNGLNATIIGAGGPIAGTAGADVIVGSAQGDVIDAGGGGDTICGARRQRLDHGGGDDTAADFDESGGAGQRHLQARSRGPTGPDRMRR